MNHDQIKALKERADKASSLAEEYSQVSECKAIGELPCVFRAEALRLAKAGILARIEAEIAELLAPKRIPFRGPEQQSPPMVPHAYPEFGELEPDGEIETFPPKPFWNMPDGSVSYRPPTDPHIGTLDSSDCWEQPS